MGTRVKKQKAKKGAAETVESVEITKEGPITQVLTPREIEIGRWVCLGLKNAEVAARLKIATKTVEAHRASSYKKLKVNNSMQFHAMMTRLGLVKPGQFKVV